jgi:hypothetical protein
MVSVEGMAARDIGAKESPSALGGEVKGAPRLFVFPQWRKPLVAEGLSRGQGRPPSLREAGRPFLVLSPEAGLGQNCRPRPSMRP